MHKFTLRYLLLITLTIFTGCNQHPKDKTHIDDLIHCGFGEEYVDGYTKSNGTKVNGYCRDQN